MFYVAVKMLDSWYQSRVRGARERFSGSVRGWLDHFGSVVQTLIWINVIVFAVQLFCAAAHFPALEWALVLSGDGVRQGFIWQPLTYMFLHDTHNLWHIIFNLFTLWFLGREVEYFIGPKYFTRLYFLGGLAGAGLWLVFNFHTPAFVQGASAAVLACVIAYATLFPDREVLVFFIPVRARILALILVAFDVVPLMMQEGGGVAHLAHLGGAAFGYLYIKQLGYGTTPIWLLRLQRFGRSLRPHRRSGTAPRYESSEEFIRRKVDPILDKIAREGMQSLTRQERKILESAKDLMQKQQR